MTLMINLKLGSGTRLALLTILVITSICNVSFAQSKSTAFPNDWFFTGDGGQRDASLKDLEGKPAPNLNIEKWIGEKVSLKESKGKVVVVDFWATWCGPCRRSIPENVEMVNKYKEKGFVFVGVHDANSGWDEAPEVIKSSKINYPVGLDVKGGDSAKAFGVRFLPTYVAIDKRGIVRAAGLLPNRVEDVVKVLLEEAGPSDADVRDREFGNEFFVGGFKRPKSLSDMEGKTLDSLPGLSERLAGRTTENDWLGSAVKPEDRSGKVLVLTFTSPHAIAMKELAAISKLNEGLAKDGVMVVGVCDARTSWDTMQKERDGKKISLPILRDIPKETGSGPSSKPVAGKPRGAIAEDLGVSLFPATIVIDQTGKIRAAGVRTDKLVAVVNKILGKPEKKPEELGKSDQPAKTDPSGDKQK